jgi:hypothetical protein
MGVRGGAIFKRGSSIQYQFTRTTRVVFEIGLRMDLVNDYEQTVMAFLMAWRLFPSRQIYRRDRKLPFSYIAYIAQHILLCALDAASL